MHKEEFNTMCTINHPAPRIGVLFSCLAVLCCASVSLAAPTPLPRDLGEFGNTYSFRMDSEIAVLEVGQLFVASHAVDLAMLSRISGGTQSGDSPSGINDGLANSVGNSGPLVAYAYSSPTSINNTRMFGSSNFVNVRQPTSDGVYRYFRDVDNKLWWAIPG